MLRFLPSLRFRPKNRRPLFSISPGIVASVTNALASAGVMIRPLGPRTTRRFLRGVAVLCVSWWFAGLGWIGLGVDVVRRQRGSVSQCGKNGRNR